ncbi:hypothetical protein B0H17DRAFT_1211687 [Mycena rosella]|uniref:NACHT domain-containing protein n=1 Tax=Mycena rosella TaxID=1033263 RepID=A0AAD7CUR4_MYCRO|nr:hypothetical protein B0H17DRAFT_1211687 [Mycena rosella]
MASSYSLLVQTIEGISWNPGPVTGKKPNLYVAIYRNGDCLANISQDPVSSTLSLRIFHDSSFPLAPDKCLGMIKTDIVALVKSFDSDGAAKMKLELTGVHGESKGKPAGIISVCLMRDTEFAALALEKAQKDAKGIALGAKTSMAIKTGGIVTNSLPEASGLVTALASVTSKLEILVHIGDEIATVGFLFIYRVLTSVYQAAKKQQENDDKLLKLVETMADAYSFVRDVDFLTHKIQSVEDKALAIVKQTVESRAVQNTWKHADQKINDLTAAFLTLKDAFEGRLIVQTIFISTKLLDKVEGLEKSDVLKQLNPVDMNGSLRTMCLPGTPREILDHITAWITVPSDSGSVLWVSGVAGCGKSTVATTISEAFRALDRLGAFLFFNRNDRSRSDPSAIIRTIAYSLALFDPRIGAAVSAVIQRDHPIHMHGPILIILDALDECGDVDSRATLLTLLSDEFQKLPGVFRLLIPSRRDSDIVCEFNSSFAEMVLDTGGPSTTQDVELFIRHELVSIQTRRSLISGWPVEDNIRALTHLSGGLFIWASTATRFMNGYRPEERLKILITQDRTLGFHLDDLYSVALRNSGPWDADKMLAQDARAVLACVVLGRAPMTDAIIDMLLYSGTQSSRDVLGYLGCVIQWSPGKEARILHTSFADYLLDPNRSRGKLWAIDPIANHLPLASGCLRILRSELRFNICGFEDSHRRNADVPGLPDRVAAMVSAQLSYAYCFWFNHVHDVPFDTIILRDVTGLLRNQFLYWLVVLSLLGSLPLAAAGLGIAVEYAKLGHDDNLVEFVSDAANRAECTPHLLLGTSIRTCGVKDR